MDECTHIFCSTCFAMPGEPCRTKFLVYAHNEVMPVICPTHSARLAESERQSMHQSLARLLCAVVLECLEQSRGSKPDHPRGLPKRTMTVRPGPQ
jgi:hypothetical protein